MFILQIHNLHDAKKGVYFYLAVGKGNGSGFFTGPYPAREILGMHLRLHAKKFHQMPDEGL